VRVQDRTTKLEKANEALRHLSSRLLSAQEDGRKRIEAAKILLYKQAWSWQNGHEYDPKMTILVRTFIDQIGPHIVSQMNDIFGGSGSDKEIITEKYIRDLFTAFHGPSLGQGLIMGAPDWKPETIGVEVV